MKTNIYLGLENGQMECWESRNCNNLGFSSLLELIFCLVSSQWPLQGWEWQLSLGGNETLITGGFEQSSTGDSCVRWKLDRGAFKSFNHLASITWWNT